MQSQVDGQAYQPHVHINQVYPKVLRTVVEYRDTRQYQQKREKNILQLGVVHLDRQLLQAGLMGDLPQRLDVHLLFDCRAQRELVVSIVEGSIIIGAVVVVVCAHFERLGGKL